MRKIVKNSIKLHKLPKNKYHHLCFVIKKGKISLFINGLKYNHKEDWSIDFWLMKKDRLNLGKKGKNQ